MTWVCFCSEVLWGWLDLENHLRLMHPDVDRDVVDVDGQVRVDASEATR